MFYLLTSHGLRGSGQTVAASALALALTYHGGKKVLLCDFQHLEHLKAVESVRSCRHVLQGYGKALLNKPLEQDFNDIINLAEHGLLNLNNLQNYTVQITPHSGLDLTEWHLNATLEALRKPVFSAIMKLATQRYDCIVIDWGALERQEIEEAVQFWNAQWVYHGNQGSFQALWHSQRTELYSQHNVGAMIGMGLKGSNLNRLMHKLRAQWRGCIHMSQEVPDSLAERGLERLFRRMLTEHRRQMAGSIVGDAVDVMRRLEKARGMK